MTHYFSFGGCVTPLRVRAELVSIVDRYRAVAAQMVTTLTTPPGEEGEYRDVCAAEHDLPWDVMPLMGAAIEARVAADMLAHCPVLTTPEDESYAAAFAHEGSEEDRRWVLVCASQAYTEMTRGPSDPASRSTSVASNLADDYRRGIYTKFWCAMPVDVRLAVLQAELDDTERRRAEYEASARARREEAAATEAARLEAKRERRAERRAARRMAEG